MNLANIRHRWLEFLREEDAATAVEYAVMLALIIVVCAGAVTKLSTATNQSFSSSGNAIVSGS